MGRAFCSRPVASILPAWGFQKLPACCLHIYIPHSRTSACGSLALPGLRRSQAVYGWLHWAAPGFPTGEGDYFAYRALRGFRAGSGPLAVSTPITRLGWLPCHSGKPLASISIPRRQVAACPTRLRWWEAFRVHAVGRDKSTDREGLGLCFPLCVSIIAPLGAIVKTFFNFFC